ncbi:hypothetical protein [Pseudomonas sp. S3(2024)]|uniref:hypothetical protein n=1 Tax=Pseudomonas sp. S3(2024) TaxID=3111912 RepID=UPI002FDFFCED
MNCDHSVLIVGGAVLIVPSAIEVIAYDDVVNALLYAQLAASKRVKSTPGTSWYDTYIEVLGGVWMWSAKARDEFDISSDSAESTVQWAVSAMSRLEVDKERVTAEVLSQMVNETQLNPAISLLRKYMQQVPEDQPTHTTPPVMNVRLLVIVAPTPTSFSCVCIEFKTDRRLSSNPLPYCYRAEEVQGPISSRYVQASLSETLYAPIRHQMALKLKDRIQGNVATLTLRGETCMNTPSVEARS